MNGSFVPFFAVHHFKSEDSFVPEAVIQDSAANGL
jgi:hypothetical protein